jgi:hypothetical protein
MKTVNQLLAVVTFALSASAFAVPSSQEEHFFTQTAEYQHTVASDGSDHTPQGQNLASDVSDHTPGMQVAADGSERALGRRLT